MAAKAQGLPINLIILAIIAALVLVLVVAFTVGGASNIFGKISKGSKVIGGDLETTRAACKSFCDRIQSVSSIDDWTKGQYCVRSFALDLDSDGKSGGFDVNGGALDGGKFNKAKQQEAGLNCWDSAIAVNCQVEVNFPDGSAKLCTPKAGAACDANQCV
ncbi:MAG: hypothetical protein HYT16_01865 [DPANN group archaeon]|nr:hypothetical protein [DPANN group archaeon]